MAQKSIQIATAVTADTTAPTATSTVGGDTNDLKVGGNVPDSATIRVAATASGAALAGIVEIFGLSRASDRWSSLGSLNGGTALAETDTDFIDFSTVILNPGHHKRLFAHITSITGTDASFDVYVEVEDRID